MSPLLTSWFVTCPVRICEDLHKVGVQIIRICSAMNLAEFALVGHVVAQQHAKVRRALQVQDNMAYPSFSRQCRARHVLAQMANWVLDIHPILAIADRNRCLLFSSSSFEAKSSELTSGVPLGLRCCQPYNVTNSSVYRSWGLTITPASVKRCLFFRNLIGSPGSWSLAGTISPPCKVNLPFNSDTNHSTASRSPPKMRSSTWEHKTKGFSLCLKRLGSSGVFSISRAWRCSQRKSKNFAAAFLWPGRHRPKTQYLVFSPSFHQLSFSTKIFSRWGTKRNASLVAAVTYQNQSCTSSWRWSKCRSHSFVSTSEFTCHIATSALPLLISEAPIHDTPCWKACSFFKILGWRFVARLHLWESRDFLIASCLIQRCKFFWTDIRRLAFVTLFTCITIITSKIDPVRFQKVSYLLFPVFIIHFSNLSNMLNVSSIVWGNELTRSRWRTPLVGSYVEPWAQHGSTSWGSLSSKAVLSPKLSAVSSLADLWGTNPWSAWPRFASSKTGISVSLAGFGGCVLAYSMTSLAS